MSLKRFFVETKTLFKEAFMPGESLDPGGQSEISIMAIVLGSICVIGGAASIAFIPPLGVTLLIVGGITAAGGVGYKVADTVIKRKKEKQQLPRQFPQEKMVNLQQSFGVTSVSKLTSIEGNTEESLKVEFESRGNSNRQFSNRQFKGKTANSSPLQNASVYRK